MTQNVAKQDDNNRNKHCPQSPWIWTWWQQSSADVSGSHLDQVPFPTGADISSMPFNLIFLSPATCNLAD